jgi:hypothetical protein
MITRKDGTPLRSSDIGSGETAYVDENMRLITVVRNRKERRAFEAKRRNSLVASLRID